MTNTDHDLIEARPLRHGLVALIVRRCPDHPVDGVTNDGQCHGCTSGLEPYGETRTA